MDCAVTDEASAKAPSDTIPAILSSMIASRCIRVWRTIRAFLTPRNGG